MNRLTCYPSRSVASLFAASRSADPSAPSHRENIEEKDDAYLIHLDLPNLRKEELQIEVKEHALTLTATPAEKRPFAASGTRSWKIGRELDPQGITANYDHGVLTIRVPKRKPDSTEPLNIPIQ